MFSANERIEGSVKRPEQRCHLDKVSSVNFFSPFDNLPNPINLDLDGVAPKATVAGMVPGSNIRAWNQLSVTRNPPKLPSTTKETEGEAGEPTPGPLTKSPSMWLLEDFGESEPIRRMRSYEAFDEGRANGPPLRPPDPLSVKVATSASVPPAKVGNIHHNNGPGSGLTATGITNRKAITPADIVKQPSGSSPSKLEFPGEGLSNRKSSFFQDAASVAPLVRLTTMNLSLVQLQTGDWEKYRDAHLRANSDGTPIGTNEHRIQEAFDSSIAQWRTRNVGPFLIYVKDAYNQDWLHFAGLLKMSLSGDFSPCDQPVCLNIRFQLAAQYRRQRRVMLETLHAAFFWIIGSLRLFDSSPCVYLPFEISASRQNAVTVASESGGSSVVMSTHRDSTDIYETGQQAMALVHKSDAADIVQRLELQLHSGDMIQQVINADIWITQSEKGMFTMDVKWEIPLVKVDDAGSVHLFMSTYHDTPVRVVFTPSTLSKISRGGEFKMRLDLCTVDCDQSILDSPEFCCRIRTKDVAPGQTSMSFNGVRKPKVGDKSKMYVIRCQLVRLTSKNAGRPVVMDSCISSVCQLTSSRRVYRGIDERPTAPLNSVPSSPIPTLSPVGELMPPLWESRSEYAKEFASCASLCWKQGFPMWLFTQEKVSFDVINPVFTSAAIMKVSLLDAKSNLPVHLVTVNQGMKTPTSVVIGCRDADDKSWSLDLRVNCKKEVQDRSCYLHVSFNDTFSDGSIDPEPDVEFTSTFVITVGTTFANLRRRPCAVSGPHNKRHDLGAF